MPSFKAAQQYGVDPTITPEYLETARAAGPDKKQKVSDSLIAEEIAKKDKDFATMWAKRSSGGDEAAKRLLNYYTYGDPNYGVQQEQPQYQFTQNDAMGYFNNPDEIIQQLQAQEDKNSTRIPGAFSIQGQGELMQEHPILGTAAAVPKMAWNAAAGVVNLGKGIVQAAANPVETVAGLAMGAVGAAELGYEKLTGTQIPEFNPDGTTTPVADTKNQATAKAIWDELITKRYGSVEAVKKTLFEDPLGVIADVLTVGEGVKLAKAGLAGRAAKGAEATRALTVAGEAAPAAEAATGPLGAVGKAIKSPLKGAKKVTDVTGAAGKEMLGYGTGIGKPAIEERLRVARLGSPEEKAALSAGIKAGTVREAEVLDDVVKGLDTILEKRKIEYQTKLESFNGAKDLLDGGPVAEAVSNSLIGFKINGRPGKLDFSVSAIPAGTPAAGEITKYLDELFSWGKEPGQNFDVVGFDTLKKRLGEVFPSDPKAKAFATPIQEAVTKVLDKVPGYSDMTGKYREMSDLIRDVKTTLSVGGRANRDTAIRKLTNALRNNNENKEAVLRALMSEAGDTTTIPKMTGVSYAPWMPRGIAGNLQVVAATMSAYDLGRLAARLASTIAMSPRLVGKFLDAIGFTQRQVDKVIEYGRKIGANKALTDEAVGVEAMVGKVADAERKRRQVDELFPDESPGQNE